MSSLELPHGFDGGVIPLAAGLAAERALFSQRLLNFRDAFGSRDLLPPLPPAGMSGSLPARLAGRGSRWLGGTAGGFSRRRRGGPRRPCCQEQRQARGNRRPKSHAASTIHRSEER